MTSKLFAIKDSKSGTFSAPFNQPNVMMAKRQASYFVNYENNMIKAFPSDYELWMLGDFNDITGDIIPSAQCICNLLELKSDE